MCGTKYVIETAGIELPDANPEKLYNIPLSPNGFDVNELPPPRYTYLDASNFVTCATCE